MKKILPIALAILVTGTVSVRAQSWKSIHNTPVKEVLENFNDPPKDYASHVIWGWEGDMELATIQHDLDSIKSKGFRSVILEPGYGKAVKYLSPQWFENIRTGVQEAKKRGMKVWIIDEGKYPSGFAGGKFSQERPDLRMKAVVAVDTIHVGKGEILSGQPVTDKAMSAVAVSKSGGANRTVEIKDGKIDFYAGLDDWDIVLAGWDYRTSQTRAVNNPTHGKDTNNSLCDYLDPTAVRQFLDWTHEQYKKYIGDEFGKTVLGFRGDEPGFQYVPWTPNMVKEFESRKGYNPTPYLASLLTENPTIEESRFHADYWDVWADLFSENFFKQEADWCEANGLAYIVHLDKDDMMPWCINMSGDLFRDLKVIQVPGIDVIWSQVWPGTTNDFPKYASSVSHVYGKPRAFSESFAAFNKEPSIPEAKYVVDFQMVRGINFFEYMFWMAGSTEKTWMSDPGMKDFNDYTNRATYIMAQGRSGAKVAVYYPTASIWLGDEALDDDVQKISNILLRHQVDYDWLDADAFSEALEVKTGYLQNLSGQKYYTLVIPTCDVIPEEVWDKVKEFTARGGKVLFWGHRPSMLAGKSFSQTKPISDLTGNCFEEFSLEWTENVASAMPEPEFKVTLKAGEKERFPFRAYPGGPKMQREAPLSENIRYTRKSLPDADIYFIFNEGDKDCQFTAEFSSTGIVREWDAYSGNVKEIQAEKKDGKTVLEMNLAKWESKIISIERASGEYNVKSYGVKAGSTPQTKALQSLIDKVYADGGGTIVIPRGTYMSGALFFPAGVNLRIEKGGVLKSYVEDDLYPVIKTRFEGTEKDWKCAFLNFTDSKGVRVYGEGTIDGNGPAWNQHVGREGYALRPRLVNFTRCDGGSIKGLTLQNQALWCLHVLYTDGFTIDGLTINAKEYTPSSDGIDLDSSNDITLTNTYIYCHDDCLSIKSGKDAEGRRIGRPSENILVENCHFAYGHGGVDIGSEVSGGVRNVIARNCTFDGGNRGPIRIKSQPQRGGVIEDIVFENFKISGAESIIDINLDWRGGNKSDDPGYSDPVTKLHGIVVRNCSGSAERLGQLKGYDIDPLPADAIRFENCSFETKYGLNVANAENISFEGMEAKVSDGPEFYKDGEFTPKPPRPITQAPKR